MGVVCRRQSPYVPITPRKATATIQRTGLSNGSRQVKVQPRQAAAAAQTTGVRTDGPGGGWLPGAPNNATAPQPAVFGYIAREATRRSC